MYRVKLSRPARKALHKLPRTLQVRIHARLRDLARDPYSRGAKKLIDTESTYRVRVGDYRILYEVVKRELLVYVISIGHRSSVYR